MKRLFSLAEAQALLPTVKRITAEAVQEAEQLAKRVRELELRDPRRDPLAEQLNGVLQRWAERMDELQLEVKGLWLVDFDNGEGYYCWRYPEASVSHYHGYSDGFAGRMKIV
jgi:hypothetical protein